MKDFVCKACCIGVLLGLSGSLWAAVSTDPIPYRNVSPMAQIIGFAAFQRRPLAGAWSHEDADHQRDGQ